MKSIKLNHVRDIPRFLSGNFYVAVLVTYGYSSRFSWGLKLAARKQWKPEWRERERERERGHECLSCWAAAWTICYLLCAEKGAKEGRKEEAVGREFPTARNSQPLVPFTHCDRDPYLHSKRIPLSCIVYGNSLAKNVRLLFIRDGLCLEIFIWITTSHLVRLAVCSYGTHA